MIKPDISIFTPFPRHVAVIMDGNRRWAEQRGLPPSAGHRAGVESLRTTIGRLNELELPFLTVFGFSTENWSRSEDEVQSLLLLLEEVLGKETGGLQRRGIQLKHLGRLEGLPASAQDIIKQSAELTKNAGDMTLSFAFNYGGRSEIIDAVKTIVKNKVAPENINEDIFADYLYTAGLPDVDLLIRTGGESRLSNFLTWQTTYSEIYFTEALWPDFDIAEVDKALAFYSQKQRRFGR